ncbi:mitosis inhibitor protein kinase [Rhypophila decipiens]
MSFSNGSGGTLTLPSPTHVHHVDVGSAVRSLRRSLSRSPSKFKLTGRSSPSPESSFNFGQSSTTPAPAARFDNFSTAAHPTGVAGGEAARPSIFSTPQPTPTSPLRSSVKLSVRSARAKTGISRPLSRTRVSPKSPLKRALVPSQDFGNSFPPSTATPETRGQENLNFGDFSLALSPVSRHDLEKPARHSVHLDVSGSSKSLAKILDFNDSFTSTSVSPLKRSDATMNLDHSNPASPVAKRRSLHGISDFGAEPQPNIFGLSPQLQPPQSQEQQGFDVHEDANPEYQLTGTSPSLFSEPNASPSPALALKRATSLRKSTLQQRGLSLGRRGGEKAAQLSHETTTPGPRNRPRLSLDQYLPPDERGSPFSPQPLGLPNPSLHFAQRPVNQQPHPLSRTLTQSSSNSSLPDDSPTHVPVHFVKPRAPMNFSRSMPVGSQRPVNDSEPVATPQYKRAKPFQAAFMSTGLVSKMTRNPDLGPAKNSVAKIAAMPDTPCKKQYNSATFPPQVGSGRRQSRPSFGSPSTPFGSVAGPSRGNLFATQDKPNSLFFQQVRSHARKNSLLSLNGEDQDAVDSADDLPPTPTKNIFFKSITTPAHGTQTPISSRTYTIPGSGFGFNETRSARSVKHELRDISNDDDDNEDSWAADAALHPRTPGTRAPSPLGFPPSSFNRLDQQSTPSRLASSANTAPSMIGVNSGWSNRVSFADRSASASPLSFQHAEFESPRTPQDSMAPPDPSSLSISNAQEDSGDVSRTPATPTTQGRRLFSNFGARRFSITPQHGQHPTDVDDCLSIRFDKSELIGKGEFSQVYKVERSPIPIFTTSIVASTPSAANSSFGSNERVFAVKKIRMSGSKERETKLREVAILKALRGIDRVVQHVDDWEQGEYLYIQTEFCSEGSLDTFLVSVGHGGRLDDFRIWKILLETAQGLAAIHEAGFIHLDLKPANIFIDFNGSLKIGDFGLATQWPAPKGIEGEGDREYIGPEILRGQYDKPADIFSLGLIILEIACNVFLPENGQAWQALREGDFSHVTPLTVGATSSVSRDANGMPTDPNNQTKGDDDLRTSLGIANTSFQSMTHDPSNLFSSPQREIELQEPPRFMVDPKDGDSLDSIVKHWMLQPSPGDRPTAVQLLTSDPLVWVYNRRTAGATVYEGSWGPNLFPVEELVDTEMTDV